MMHKWRSVVVVFCCQVQCDGQCNEWQFSWKRCIGLTVCAVLASRYVILWNGEGWGFQPWGLRWECLCLIQMRCVWYLCNLSSMSVWLAVRVSVLCGKDFNMDPFHANLSINFSYACHADRHHWPLPFYATLSYLCLGWGSQESKKQKAKPVTFILSHTCQVIRIKFKYGIETLYVEHSKATFWWNKLCHRKKLQFYWLSKNFNIGVHSAVYTPIWFKLGVVIDTTGLYFLI